jgi:hypothetical protein
VLGVRGYVFAASHYHRCLGYVRAEGGSAFFPGGGGPFGDIFWSTPSSFANALGVKSPLPGSFANALGVKPPPPSSFANALGVKTPSPVRSRLHS